MAVYSARYGYIFFANPQTASKAIALTLRKRLGGVALPDREISRDGKTLARLHHTTYSQILAAGLLSKRELDGLFKFTCVRNPFDQLVSKYIKYCQRYGDKPASYPWMQGLDPSAHAEHSFGPWLAWLETRFVENDKLRHGPLEFLDHADLVIRFEALQEGFDEFLRRIGVDEPLSIFEHNVTPGRADTGAAVATEAAAASRPKKKRYTEYYDADSVARVERLYAPILQRFDYRFEA